MLWTIESRKFDQRLHYTFPAHFVDDDGVRLRLCARPGLEINYVTGGRQWAFTRPFDLVFWRDRWYNIYLNGDENGDLNHYYCNVALPPTVQEHTITFVDLDLDVRIYLDGRHEILDEDEFIEHTALFGYPDDVQKQARQTVQDILTLWHTRQYPFNGVLPPGSALTR